MSSITQQFDSAPLPPDEGYWAALLQEGEFSASVPLEQILAQENDIHAHFAEDEFPHLAPNNGGLTEDWEAIQRIMSSDDSIKVPVIGYNRGGLLVEWNSLRGFVPASQLVDSPQTPQNKHLSQTLTDYIGNTLKLRVIELNAQENRLILSERAAKALPGERANILGRLRAGDIIEGTITNICEFGAFVDIGGLEGLIHISELSWGRVRHPADLLERDQKVTAYVIEINPNAGRIALSLKRLHPDPWQTVHLRYQIGQEIEGIITTVVEFGAFIRIEEGLEGLAHISELAEGHFLHPRNVVNEGQLIRARVISIDGKARRLGLSLRENA